MPDVKQYNARWYVVKKKGVISMKDADENQTDLEFTDAAEFGAVLAVLECKGDAWLGDYHGERIISSGRVDDF